MKIEDFYDLVKVLAPFLIGIIGMLIRFEISLATMKNDICWLKKKSLERRHSDKFNHAEET